ncbi:hypothetical protein H0H93_007818 [Arthromyces matolae]|nr:hypothetical protein H0H93_007818 [Arthromyces matolae]
MYGGPQQGYFINSIQNITGIKRYKDLNGGTPNCVSVTPLTINWHDQGHRASAPEAYYTPVQNSRTNLLVLTNHQATKLLFSGTSLPLTATGVEFAASGGTTNTTTRYRAFAKREVILAAGAIQTPALLQLSGIGDSTLLSSLGVQTLINLPVGRNLQEQPMSTLGANPTNFNLGGSGPSNVIAYPNLAQLFNNNITSVMNKISGNIPVYAAKLASLGAGINEQAIEEILGIQRDLVGNPNGIIMWALLPFSRGSVSIKSTNPFVYPTVKVNYFAADVDMDIQVATARLSRKILSTPPLSTLTTSEQIPGSAVPDNAQRGTDAAWKSWISQNYVSVAHPIGSASMMRRDLGVNAQLQVYDTNNVRIVDASVMPMQISAHLSATLYGVAEKAADLIKAAQ